MIRTAPFSPASGAHHEAGVVRRRGDLLPYQHVAAPVEDTERSALKGRGQHPAPALLHVVGTERNRRGVANAAVAPVDAERPVVAARDVDGTAEKGDVLRRRVRAEPGDDVAPARVVDRDRSPVAGGDPGVTAV